MNATPAETTDTSVPFSSERARGLFRWNAVLSGLHAIQGLIILAISLAAAELVTTPVVSSYLTFDTATDTLVPAEQALFDLPIGPAVATVLLPQCRCPCAAGLAGPRLVRTSSVSTSPRALDRVRPQLERHDRHHRRPLGHPGDRHARGLFGINAAMNLFGWSMESANRVARRPSGTTTCSASSPASCPGSSSASRSGRLE